MPVVLGFRLRVMEWLIGSLETASLARVYSFEEAARTRGRRGLEHEPPDGEAQVIALHAVPDLVAEG